MMNLVEIFPGQFVNTDTIAKISRLEATSGSQLQITYIGGEKVLFKGDEAEEVHEKLEKHGLPKWH